MDAKWFRSPPDDWLQHVLGIHFHPEYGSKYWIGKANDLGLNVLVDVKHIEDLGLFGPMDERALTCRPIEDFIPQMYLKEKRRFILGDTGGTLGIPKVTAYREDEFYMAFVEYFGYIAETLDFPKELNWLWIGPSGPHIIGKAARALSKRMGSMDPFAIDFDPRWVKKLTPGSLAWNRYFQHIEEQAIHILNTQDIGVLFSTPPIIERLASKMDERLRHRIRGVHYGGLPLDSQSYQKMKTELFPGAVHISGYGNTLFGVCLEVDSDQNRDLHYFSPGPRLIFKIVQLSEDPMNKQEQHKRLGQIVGYGKRGQVVFHRLDESFLILNMFERDHAVRIPPSSKAQTLGLFLDGLAEPFPLAALGAKMQKSVGLY